MLTADNERTVDVGVGNSRQNGEQSKPAVEWASWKLEPPPENDKGVGSWIWGKYQYMLRHRDRQELPQLWLHFHELYRSRLFRTKSKYAQVPINIFFKTINNLKANLTDSKPRASITAKADTTDEAATAWQASYDTWWDSTKQQHELQESVGNSELYGFQTDKMMFNAEFEGGLGEVETVRTDTFGVLFWPGSKDVQKDPMVCFIEAMDLGSIYRKWPEHEGKVTAEAAYSEQMGESRKDVRGNRSKEFRKIGTPTGYYVPEDGGDKADEGGGVQKALVVEMWVKDYSMVWEDPMTGQVLSEDEKQPPVLNMEPQVIEDPMTGLPVTLPPIEPVLRSKYPGFIRCVHVTNSGELVLSDAPNPSINPEMPREITSQTYLFDKFPVLRRHSYSDDISEYGLAISEMIEPLIIEISKKISQIAVHLDTSCRPILLLPKNCGIRKEDVNNLPSRAWEVVAALSQFIRYVPVPPLPSDYNNFIMTLLKLVEIVTGLTDVSEGRRPSGVTAASAIAALQEKAQTIFREKIRNLDLYLEEQGRMYISLAQNWYTEERKLIYQGEDGKQIIPFKGTDESFAGEFAFTIESGSTLPRNRFARQQQMIELAKAGFVDQQAILEEFNVHKRDEIMKRMQQGPLMAALEKVGKTGIVDEQTLEIIKQILTMSDQDYANAFPHTKPRSQLGMTMIEGAVKQLAEG